MKRYIGLILVIVVLLLVGCKKTEKIITEKVEENTNINTEENIDDQISQEVVKKEDEITDLEEIEDIDEIEVLEPVDYAEFKVNELGDIMVVMYHGIGDNAPYQRTAEGFLSDLNYMYEHNYRLVSLSDYMKQTIDIAAGMTPIVFTFDDGLATTFSLHEVGGNLEIVPGTALGILEEFIIEHPDFGKGGSLFLHATNSNYSGAGTQKERLEWLIDHGYEIGNHSATHANFGKLSGESIIEEVGRVDAFIGELLPDYVMNTLTYPFGKRPDSAYQDMWQTATYKGRKMNYILGLREGPSGKMVPPLHNKFQPFNAPRVRGSEGEIQDMIWFFNYYDNESPNSKYISDGNKDTLVIPESEKANLNESLLGDLEVIIY